MNRDEHAPEWIRHRVKRWVGSQRVGALSAAERGVYHELLVFEALGGPFVWDAQRIARMVRLGVEELEAAWPTLVELGLLHRLEDGRWSNETVAEERSRALEAASKRSAAAKKAATQRWRNADRMRDALPDAVQKEKEKEITNPPQPPGAGGGPAGAGGGWVREDPSEPESAPDEPRGPRGLVASEPAWAVGPLDQIGMRARARRAEAVAWAERWRDPGRVLRAVVGRALDLKVAEPAGLLAHAIENGNADEWLQALDRGAPAQSAPLAQRAVPWDEELEAVVLGLAGQDRGYPADVAEELALERYGGRYEARRRFAEAVVQVLEEPGAADAVRSLRPLSAYADVARQIAGGVVCG